MIKRSSLSLLALAIMAPALAQPLPFDMSPEESLIIPTPEQQDVAPVPAIPAVEPFARYLAPRSAIRLEGEDSRSAMVVYLTEAQAQAQAKLEFSYLNALVVAPEISSLRVRLNRTEIVSMPLAASSTPSARSIDIPAGLLRPGPNIIEFLAAERHRTDCSVASTYELWAEIDSATARLVFEGDNLSRLSQLSELAAIGVDDAGMTSVRLLAPSLTDPAAASAAVKLAQNLALALRVPQLEIEPVEALSDDFAVGVLDLVLMPADQLPPELAQARAQAEAGPIAAMLTLPSGANTLVVSGPNWAAIAQASEALVTDVADQPRIDLADPHPLMLGGQTISLADLSTDTAEFNGRRLTERFQFELPADFYAYRYGELDLVLDAAYSSDVLPGSEIDVYTNGQIASATPLLRTDGGQLRDTVIRIPMTSLRPGRNEAVISVNLLASSDNVCSPGWTGDAPVRFVLSNSSQLRFPNYARAGVTPDLQVLTGTGWPYAEAQSVPLVIGSGQDSVLSAMMFSARIATASGRTTPLKVVSASELTPETNGFVVMPMSEMTPPMLGRSGISAGSTARAPDAALDRFNGNAPSGPLEGPVNWLLEGLGLRMTDLRIAPMADAPFPVPPGGAALSQVRQGEGGLWTILTASDNDALLEGTQRLVVTETWRQIGGRVASLSPNAEGVNVVQPNQPTLVDTQPLSLGNYRLIAANWFSGNILFFAGAVLLAGMLLTFMSSFVLKQLGRGD